VELKPLEKRWLVEQHAMWTPMAEILELFVKEFPGRAVDYGQAWEYNLANPKNRRRRGPDLIELFDSTRDRFIVETRDIRIASKAYRLRELDALYHDEKAAGYRKAAKATLEQAAKEVGDVFTNKVKTDVTSKDQPVEAVVFYLPSNGRDSTA
jgi:hypothetical protein